MKDTSFGDRQRTRATARPCGANDRALMTNITVRPGRRLAAGSRWRRLGESHPETLVICELKENSRVGGALTNSRFLGFNWPEELRSWGDASWRTQE